MQVHQELYEHPTQASDVRLAVFEQQPPEQQVGGRASPDERRLPGDRESRLGAGKVVSTLGFFPSREEAAGLPPRAGAQVLERQLLPARRLPPEPA